MSPLTRRRKLFYAVLAAALAGAGVAVLLLAADVFAHVRTEHVAGVNVWGYRGSPVPRKQPGEVRIVMAGGSTVFGWGLPDNESIPAFLERRLNQRGGGRRYSVVNLGAPGQGAYGFVFDLEDFAYLDYDIVCLYEGYNDIGTITQRGLNNFLLWRRDSPVFRWTGYFPILPIVLREKAASLGGGSSDQERVQFRAGAARRAVAGAMTAVADATNALSSHPGGPAPLPENQAVSDECVEPWRRYCGSVRGAVEWSLAHGKRVLFITQPYVSDLHVEQQANVAAMLRARFAGDPRVRYVNLGDAIDMRDRTIAYDGVHLVAAGNDTIASRLVDPVMDAANAR